MLHLVTQTALQFLDVNREFKSLRFEQILPTLAELLDLSEVTLEEDITYINTKRTLNAVPIQSLGILHLIIFLQVLSVLLCLS